MRMRRQDPTFLPLDVVRTLSIRPIEMLESPAYRALSLPARKVIDRIDIELAQHWGYDNGRLQVTAAQFIEYGLSRNAVAPAIREAEALGFVRINDYGEFALTYCGQRGMHPRSANPRLVPDRDHKKGRAHCCKSLQCQKRQTSSQAG
jgi:hypothetical protein